MLVRKLHGSGCFYQDGDYKFLSSLIVLGDSDIDLILGMDWLSKHKAQLDCAARGFN